MDIAQMKRQFIKTNNSLLKLDSERGKLAEILTRNCDIDGVSFDITLLGGDGLAACPIYEGDDDFSFDDMTVIPIETLIKNMPLGNKDNIDGLGF